MQQPSRQSAVKMIAQLCTFRQLCRICILAPCLTDLFTQSQSNYLNSMCRTVSQICLLYMSVPWVWAQGSQRTQRDHFKQLRRAKTSTLQQCLQLITRYNELHLAGHEPSPLALRTPAVDRLVQRHMPWCIYTCSIKQWTELLDIFRLCKGTSMLWSLGPVPVIVVNEVLGTTGFGSSPEDRLPKLVASSMKMILFEFVWFVWDDMIYGLPDRPHFTRNMTAKSPQLIGFRLCFTLCTEEIGTCKAPQGLRYHHATRRLCRYAPGIKYYQINPQVMIVMISIMRMMVIVVLAMILIVLGDGWRWWRWCPVQENSSCWECESVLPLDLRKSPLITSGGEGLVHSQPLLLALHYMTWSSKSIIRWVACPAWPPSIDSAEVVRMILLR